MSLRTAFALSTVALTASLLAGCVSTDYIGKTYAPTAHVDVFFHEEEISPPHELMGRIRAEAPDLLTFEQMEQQLVKEAMEHGADAIVILGMDTVEVGSTTNTSGSSAQPHYVATTDGKLKQVGGHERWSSTAYTTVQKDKVLTATLIKYLE